MKNYKKIVAVITSMTIMLCATFSCGKEDKTSPPIYISDLTEISAVNPMDLEELPRTEYECSEVDYLSGISNITNISPLDNNRYLVITEEPSAANEAYGAIKYQKLYVADDMNKTVTEITLDLGVNETAYSSVMGTRDGLIFAAVIEPEYENGKNPGNASEENLAQDHINYLFDHAKNVNYKLFILNTDGKVLSESNLDIDYNKKEPVSWLVCNDYWDEKLVISALIVSEKNYLDIEITDYVVEINGDINGKIKNNASRFKPNLKKTASDGKLCFVGTDYDADEPHERIDFYDKDNYELSETVSIKCENFDCDTRQGRLITGTSGHGEDLMYLSSGIGLFSIDKDGKYENIINYLDHLSDNMKEITAVTVLDNNTVFVLASGFFVDECCTKNIVYRFESK